MATNIELLESIVSNANRVRYHLRNNPVEEDAAWVNGSLREIDNELDELHETLTEGED
jgi:hypothetical protein